MSTPKSNSGVSVPGAAGSSTTSVGAPDANRAGVSTHGITVLVSTSVHPQSGRPCPSRNDTLALELARQLARAPLRTLHVGDPQDAALSDYLAFGASSVEVLPATPSDDVVATLTDHVRNAALILCGTRAQSGEASGMLPYLLAAALKRPILANVLDVQLIGDSVQATQFLPKGRRRTVTVTLPAIIAVHPLATAHPRYAYARRVAGRIETLPRPTANTAAATNADTAVPAGAGTTAGTSAHQVPPPAPVAAATASAQSDAIATAVPHVSSWTLEPTDRVPVKLKAPDRRSGHARMLAATAAASRGGQVVNEGSNVEKAQAVLAYLREHDLIAF